MIVSALRISGFLGGIGVLTMFVFVEIVEAAEGLVPCDGRDCGTCQLVLLASNIMEFLVFFLISAIALIFGWAGVMVMTSGGDSGKVTQAKKVFSNVFVGLIIAICSWLIVDTGLKLMLINSGEVRFTESIMGPWNEIPANACSSQQVLVDGDVITVGSSWEGVGPVYASEDASSADFWFESYIVDESNRCVTQIQLGGNTENDCLAFQNSALEGHEAFTIRECNGTINSRPPVYDDYPICTNSSGGGTCSVLNSGACSVPNLESIFGVRAHEGSQICGEESGGAPVLSGSDLCCGSAAASCSGEPGEPCAACGGAPSFSGGYFQINILANDDLVPGCNMDSVFDNNCLPGKPCQTEGSCVRRNEKGVCTGWSCEITQNAMYNTCMQGALNSSVNLTATKILFDRSGFEPWANSADACSIPY